MPGRPTWNPPPADVRRFNRALRIHRKVLARSLHCSPTLLKVRALRASYRGAAFVYLASAALDRQLVTVCRALGTPHPGGDVRRALAEASWRAQLWELAGGRLP